MIADEFTPLVPIYYVVMINYVGMAVAILESHCVRVYIERVDL